MASPKRIASLCLLLLLTAIVSSAFAQEKVVKIGALYPMTGRSGIYGMDSVAAAEMAVEEINAKGGVAGYKIQFINTDSKAKPDYSVTVAKRYISDDKVHFLFGVVSSAVGLALTEVSKQEKKIFIGTDHAATELTAQNLQPYYFRVSNNTFQSMAAGALYLKELAQTKPWKTIAYIGPDYAYGHAQFEELKFNLDRFGVKYQVVGDFWPKLFESDYTSYITSIVQAKPDILVSGFWGGDTVAFIKQAVPYGLFEKSLYFHPDAGGNYELLSAMGDSLPLGLVLSARHHNNWPDTAMNKDYVTKFHKKTGRYPTYSAEGAYVGVYAIAEAVKKVGSPDDSDALVKALEGMKFQQPEDPEGFVSFIDPASHQIVQMQAIGVTVPNTDFPPATRMLGQWKVYKADELLPPKEWVEKKK
ncbi:ABC transporter substrate-binding protein [Fundidesulfovibrio putealis]|uniref:ABC transporter substrate-binding protein n=1 Tax=Fundidesulfovibrio putealis TaxID=270496 RepID=UPI0004863C8B|nr:ABC transporter substrate-binding protein [Fundidesulfovibrio putealis]